jgi:hypothetical protein
MGFLELLIPLENHGGAVDGLVSTWLSHFILI